MLERALNGLDNFYDPNVLVGFETADDAGVYRLDDETAIVQTADFFTPIVDDPFTYGQIAASNSLSDIYAMGGSPRFALSIVGFPEDQLEEEILHQVLRGGVDKMREARVPVIGGHSVKDPEIKFGYVVTGLVSPNKIYRNSGALPGDALVLTKPIGTGIISTAIKFGKCPETAAHAAIDNMLQLNATAAAQLERFNTHAVTDITGYGLLGQAYEMALGSGVCLELSAARVPLLPGTADLARKGMLPGGIESNRRFVGGAVAF